MNLPKRHTLAPACLPACLPAVPLACLNRWFVLGTLALAASPAPRSTTAQPAAPATARPATATAPTDAPSATPKISPTPTPTPTPLPPRSPDLTRDGVVNSTDLMRLLESIGLPADASPAATRADLDRDGVVTAKDLAMMVTAFGVIPSREIEPPCMVWCPQCNIWLPCAPIPFLIDWPCRDLDPNNCPGEDDDELPSVDPDDLGAGSDPPDDPDKRPPPRPSPRPACDFRIDGARSTFANGGATFTARITSGEPLEFGEVEWQIVSSAPADSVQVKGASLLSSTLSLVLGDGPAVVALQAAVTRNGMKCVVTHTFTIRGIEILDNMGETAEYLNIGHWGEDTGGNQLSGYTSNGEVRNTPDDVFIDSDPDAYFVTVADMDANTDRMNLETIQARVLSVGGIAENSIALTLTETGPDTGVFISESLLLVSRDIPPPVVVTDDDLAVWSDTAEEFVPDGQENDRTLQAMIDSTVLALYQPPNIASLSVVVPVTQREPEDRKTLRLRVRVHREPFMDVGIIPDLDSPLPHGPFVGEGNGVFDFEDLNGNGRHDPGEPSEPYLDLSMGVIVVVTPQAPLDSFYIRGEAIPIPFVSDGRGPVVTTQQVLAEIERANIAWVQAGVRVVRVGSIIEEDASNDSSGVNMLHDGWVNLNNLVADAVTTITSIGMTAIKEVAEVIFSGPLTFSGSTQDAAGWAYIPWLEGQIDLLPNAFDENTYLFIAPTISLGQRTLAHEIGHALTNRPDTYFIPYIYFPADAPAPDDSTPQLQRRLRHDTDSSARKKRTPSDCLICPGNTLLVP